MNPTKFKVADILQCCPVIELPTGKARQVILAMTKLMRQVIPAEDEPHLPLFKALFLLMECLPVLLLRTGSARAARGPVVSSRQLAKSEAELQHEGIMRNCGKFLKGNWSNLWNQTVKFQVGANERAQQAADQHQVPAGAMADKATLARAIDQARRGNAIRAMALLRSPGLVDGTQETVH